MPCILATATAPPPHRLPQRMAREFARRHFAARLPDVERLLPVFEHAGIEARDLCEPLEWHQTPRSFAAKNDAAVAWAEELGAECAARCLERAGVSLGDVTDLIFVCTTGLATPSLDARLLQGLGAPRHVRRTPLFGLGCAGGAAGLAHANRAAQADPRARVLLVAVETTSLTFLQEDGSKSNLVATALFGDGAAAVLVAGDEVGGGGLRITAARSTLYEDTLAVMGWNFQDHGLQVVFSREIPGIVRRHSRADVDAFLHDRGATRADVDAWVVHPGGIRVLEAYEEALELPADALATTRGVLRDHGNMSSATVLYVLDRFLASGRPGPGELAFVSALGPGFSSEHLLLARSH